MFLFCDTGRNLVLEGMSRFCGTRIAMGGSMLGSELDIRNSNILPPKRGESWRPPSLKFVRLSLEKVRGLKKNGGLQVFF